MGISHDYSSVRKKCGFDRGPRKCKGIIYSLLEVFKNYKSEIQFSFRCICSLYPRNIFRNVEKGFKILHLHIHNLSAFVKFRRETICFMIYVRFTKNVIRNALF
jgi:hypothetical protein